MHLYEIAAKNEKNSNQILRMFESYQFTLVAGYKLCSNVELAKLFYNTHSEKHL